MIILAETLEHLEPVVYSAAISEIKRLKADYLLVTVPYKQNLNEELSRCGSCGNKFNVRHHYRSFDDTFLIKEFDEFEKMKMDFSEYYSPVSEWLLFLKHTFGDFFYSSEALCDKCGGKAVRPPGVLRFFFRTIVLMEKLLKKMFSLQKPAHMLLLLKRRN